MTQTREFMFLYPIPEIINFEIKNHGWSEKGGVGVFREKYSDVLNECINKRYRQKGFGINYAVFDGSPVSEVVKIQSTDRIIEVGVDFKTHIARKAYPDQDSILNKLNGTRVLRVAGFHMWDCVEKLAKRAYEKGWDVLVDEDLTEFLTYRFRRDPDFKTEEYPTYNARKNQGHMFPHFIKVRRERPWLWQNY